jgi:hypothetical protein
MFTYCNTLDAGGCPWSAATRPTRLSRVRRPASRGPLPQSNSRFTTPIPESTPEHPSVLCIDEKSQVQTLDRSLPVLSIVPGTPERRTHNDALQGVTQPVRCLQPRHRRSHTLALGVALQMPLTAFARWRTMMYQIFSHALNR